MSDADSLRAQIQSAIRATENVQKIALMYEQAIHELQQQILILDLGSENPYIRTAARIAPGIGENLPVDHEVVGHVKERLQDWLPHV